MEALGAKATPAWPVAFTRIAASAEEFLEKYPCNHIHGVYGDYVEEAAHHCGDPPHGLPGDWVIAKTNFVFARWLLCDKLNTERIGGTTICSIVTVLQWERSP